MAVPDPDPNLHPNPNPNPNPNSRNSPKLNPNTSVSGSTISCCTVAIPYTKEPRWPSNWINLGPLHVADLPPSTRIGKTQAQT